MLADKPRQQLADLIARYGHSLCNSPRRCRALLKDFCPEYKLEVNVLTTALRENVCRDLLAARGSKFATVLTSQLIKRLQKEAGLREESARWAVESWAMALGVGISPQLPYQPEEINSKDDIERNDRAKCSYESCIDLIGPDGQCKERSRGHVFASENDSDWKNRTLCIDESCIGVIGSDGRCKECGRAYISASENDSDWKNRTLCIDETCIGVIGSDGRCKECGRAYVPASDNDIDWKNRTLCIDESCIGVIGPDGRCKECGRAY